MKTKFFFLLVFATAISFAVNAQISSVKLMDLTLIPAIEVANPTGEISKLNISFKINHASLASAVHLQLGTAQGQGNIMTLDAMVVNSGDGYRVEYQGQQYPVYGIQASFIASVTPQQWEDFTVASLYVTDTEGQDSEIIYFNK